jgi:hypothetical protein
LENLFLKKFTTPASTASVERSFSYMNLIKTPLRSDSYFVDKISQFRIGGNSQKSQQKPCVYTAYYNPEIGASISCAESVELIFLI